MPATERPIVEKPAMGKTAPGVLESGDTETVFPWSLVDEICDGLEEKRARTLRYCDLETADSWCGSGLRYLDEYIQFRTGRKTPVAFIRGLVSYAAIRWGDSLPRLNKMVEARASRKLPPTVILQHDADLLPDKTCQMMRIEEQRGLRSSCYFFVQHATEESYHLDIAALQAFEQRGFEIGYHQNAFERADYDEEQAYRLVDQDLQWLKQKFNIRSFVPHGGEPAADGRNNEHLAKKYELQPLLWAYNGKCILKDYTWSDGGIKKRSPIDPRVFVSKLVQGTRAMMLMHPQYYGNILRDDWESLPIAKEKWWRELWGL